jgi:HEAT repeat protein
MPPAIPVADGGKATPEEVPALPLEQAIATWGELGQAFRIPELARFATHADSNVRTAVAVALGKIALKQRGAGVERMVPVLGKLSRDVNQQVRLEAITALSQIRSASVLPWLQQALRSPDGETNKAASLALQRSRLSQTPKPAKPARVPLQRRK